jgi:predicted nucleic acid-binding protein
LTAARTRPRFAATPRDLSLWLQEAGLLERPADVTDARLRGAHRLREAIDTGVQATIDHIAIPAKAMDMSSTDVGQARKIINRHADLGITLADASIVVLAERHDVREVLTLDQRHFRVLAAAGEPFRVLPADA